MTLSEFKENIYSALTSGDAIPKYINDKELERIITFAKKWFYINYEKSVETRFFVLEKHEYQKEEFKKSRTFLLPDCVQSIIKFTEVRGGSVGFINAGLREVGIDRMVAGQVLFSSNIGDELVSLTAAMQFYDLTKAFYVTDISFDFNYNSKKLIVTGRTPVKDTVLKTMVSVEDQFLFDDPYFFDYCLAQGKLSTARIIGAFEFNLPGGARMNKDIFQSEGEQDLQRIKEEISNLQPANYFVMFG